MAPRAPQSAGSNSASGTSLPLGGNPTPVPQLPGGSTPPTLSGMGQGSCSLPLGGTPTVIGYGSDPAFQQPQGQMASGSGNPFVAPSQVNPNANPNPGAL